MIAWMITTRYLRRRPFNDLGSYCSLAAVALLIVVVIMPKLAEARGFPVRGYGVFLMLAIICSTGLVLWRGKRKWNIPPDTLVSIATVGVLCGILGARTFFVFEYWSTIVADSCWGTICNIFNMANGGLVVYGSIIGGIFGVLAYLTIRKLPVLATLDLFAPGLMLGIAIGRLGCLMNGCCFGAVCDGPPGITFPVGSPAHVHQLETGEASLAGIVLKPAQSNIATRTVFSLKHASQSLWTAEPGPVVIASVDADSPAARAGMKPGMIIKQIGYAGNCKVVDANIQKRLQLVEVYGNGDFFHFLYTAMMNSPRQSILFVCHVPDKNISADAKQAEAESKTERFVFVPNYATIKAVWPSQIISSLAAFLLCFVLLALDRIYKRDGLLFVTMLFLYAANRFFLELVRTDEASFLGTGLSVSQCVSIVTTLVALVVFAYILRSPAKQAYADYQGKFSTEKGE